MESPAYRRASRLQASDLRGLRVLQKLARQQRAKAALGKAITPGQPSLSALGLALLAVAANLFVERNSIPESLASAAVGIVVASASIAVGQWRIERRPDAVIAHLELDEARSTPATRKSAMAERLLAAAFG
jgi:hypothetical protein